MGKKNSGDTEPAGRKMRKGKVPFSCLGYTFESVDTDLVKRHMGYLILAVILAKILVALITTVFFNSFVDLFDIGIYLKHAVMPFEGQFPYDAEFQYPVLIFIPMMIAVVPAMMFQNAMAFVFTFQALMVLCDIVTILCVYLICLKLWDEKTAFYAGLLYAAAFSAAYFVITKYDAFPAALLMLALLFTLYGHTMKGYAASVLGAFAKVFPGLAFPFLVLYNAKKADLKQEVISALKVGVPLFIILFIPLFLLNPETYRIYVPVRSELGYYSNTATFTLYTWLHDVLKIGISIDTVSAVMYAIMGLGILALLWVAWKIPKKDPVLLLKLILCAVVLTVICSKVRSPQYIVWFTPLLCILAVDDIKKIAALLIFQALAYIEFPLMFGAYYTALTYTQPAGSSGWMLTLVMFSLEYLALLICLWLVVKPAEIADAVKTASR